MNKIDKIFNIIIKDEKFIKNIKLYLFNIMKDDKIDQYDIPDLVFIITDTINSFDSFNLEYNDIPILIKLLLNYINDEYNIIPNDREQEFNKLIDSSLRLIMLQPKIKESFNNCISSCSKLC